METVRLCQRFHSFTLTHSQLKEGGTKAEEQTRTQAMKERKMTKRFEDILCGEGPCFDSRTRRNKTVLLSESRSLRDE